MVHTSGKEESIAVFEQRQNKRTRVKKKLLMVTWFPLQACQISQILYLRDLATESLKINKISQLP